MASDQKQTTVVLAVDSSNSMAAKDVSPSRIAAARAAARELIKGLPKNAKARARLVRARRAASCSRPRTTARRSATRSRTLTLRGGTTLGTAIDRSVASLRASHAGPQGAGDHRDLRRQEHRGHPLADRSGTGRQGRRSPRLHGLARHGRRHRHGERQAGRRAARSDDAAPRRRRPAAGASTGPRTPRRCRTPTTTSAAR